MDPGRPLLSHEEAELRGFWGPECRRRRSVLAETLAALEAGGDHYARLAQRNLDAWAAAAPATTGLTVEVVQGDWGEVAGGLTRRHGVRFAVLNMANAYVPGGAYVEGAPAQEENMFRRTDCALRVTAEEYDAARDRYRPELTRLLNAEDGRVYLDLERPRVCVRGREDRARPDLGYRWLGDDEVFPFVELRSAAVDRRDGSAYDEPEMRRRIAAQLDTLAGGGVRHAVLGAFGCGAFRNPADRVAALYREEIERRREHFSVIGFAVFDAGYGPDNHTPFAEVFA